MYAIRSYYGGLGGHRASEVGGHARGADEDLATLGFQVADEFFRALRGAVRRSHGEAAGDAQLFEGIGAGPHLVLVGDGADENGDFYHLFRNNFV